MEVSEKERVPYSFGESGERSEERVATRKPGREARLDGGLYCGESSVAC